MGLIVPYYNTRALANALENLTRSLPDPSAPFERRQPTKPTRTARPLRAERADALVAGYLAGDSVHELSHRFHVSHETVNQIVRRREIPLRPRGLSPEQIDEAVRLYEEGSSLGGIGKRLDVDARTVQRRLQERGAPMRAPGGHSA